MLGVCHAYSYSGRGGCSQDECPSERKGPNNRVAGRPKLEPFHDPTEITLSTVHRPPPGSREADRWRLVVREQTRPTPDKFRFNVSPSLHSIVLTTDSI